MSSAPPPGNDWVSQVVSLVDRTVGTVRDKTTRPVSSVARAAVWGLMAALLAMVAVVLGLIGAHRTIVILTGGRAYLAHMLLGIILVLVGLVLMRKRHAPEES